MSHLKTTLPAIALVLALAAIPISQQISERTRLRSELQAARDQAANPTKTARGPRSVSRGLAGNDEVERWSPRTAGSMLDEMATPADPRAVAKELISAIRPFSGGEDHWALTMVFSRLNSMSEEEYDEFLNALADFPAPEHSKKLVMFTIQLTQPGLAESWQEALERVMARGRGDSLLSPMSFWTREDPEAALAWYREKVDSGEIFGKGIDTPFERKVFGALIRTLSESQPERALDLFESRAPERRTEEMGDGLTEVLASAMVKTGDDTHLLQMIELHDTARVLRIALKEHVSAFKFGEGVAFIDRFVTDPGQRADFIVEGVRGQDGVGRKGAALNWLRDNTPEAEAPELFRRLGASGDIGFWLKTEKPGPLRDQGHLGRIEHRMESREFSEAFADAKNIGDQTLRASAQDRVGRAWLQHDEAEATEGLPVEVLRQIQNQ